MNKPFPCYHCKKLIQFVQGYVSRTGKLFPLDWPSGEPHKHIFEGASL